MGGFARPPDETFQPDSASLGFHDNRRLRHLSETRPGMERGSEAAAEPKRTCPSRRFHKGFPAPIKASMEPRRIRVFRVGNPSCSGWRAGVRGVRRERPGMRRGVSIGVRGEVGYGLRHAEERIFVEELSFVRGVRVEAGEDFGEGDHGYHSLGPCLPKILRRRGNSVEMVYEDHGVEQNPHGR